MDTIKVLDCEIETVLSNMESATTQDEWQELNHWLYELEERRSQLTDTL